MLLVKKQKKYTYTLIFAFSSWPKHFDNILSYLSLPFETVFDYVHVESLVGKVIFLVIVKVGAAENFLRPPR